MKIIYYSGSYDINALGATKTIDLMIVKNLIQSGFEVCWVARGSLKETNCEFFNLSPGRLISLILKVKFKLKRELLGKSVNDVAIEEFITYDEKLAKLISNGKLKVNKDTIMIARNGMSLSSFKAVKRLGGKCVLHSQWLHPLSHKKALTSVYKKLSINAIPIPKSRTDRQIKEISMVDKVWSISSLVTNSYLENQYPQEKIFNCSLGVDLDKYNRIAHLNKGEGVTIVFVGNVNAEKGVHDLFASICNLGRIGKNLTLILNGSLSPDFKGVFDSYMLKLSRLSINVKLCPGDPLDSYSSGTFFILPSIHESFGLVVLEAMASGLPVIVSDKVGAKDCVKHGENGFIFSVGNVQELTHYMTKLINDPELVETMGKKSYGLSQKYSWAEVTRNLIKEVI